MSLLGAMQLKAILALLNAVSSVPWTVQSHRLQMVVPPALSSKATETLLPPLLALLSFLGLRFTDVVVCGNCQDCTVPLRYHMPP